MEVNVSRHAAKRTKERVGLSKKIADKNAQKALDEGITHAETKGSLKRYLDSIYFTNRSINNIRVYQHSVYLFAGPTLVTILSLPQKYRNTVNNIRKNRRRE